jgi:hypothetical protein
MKRILGAGLLSLVALGFSTTAQADGPFRNAADCIRANLNTGLVPGPWYTYWAYDGGCSMSSPYATPCWTYESNFQTSAPIYPYWPTSPTPATQIGNYPTPYSLNSFQPGGYYPSYWYGR